MRKKLNSIILKLKKNIFTFNAKLEIFIFSTFIILLGISIYWEIKLRWSYLIFFSTSLTICFALLNAHIFYSLIYYDETDKKMKDIFSQLSDFFYTMGITLSGGGLLTLYTLDEYKIAEKPFFYTSPILMGLIFIILKNYVLNKSKVATIFGLITLMVYIFFILFGRII
jgi:hypothetical protein